MKKFDRKGAPPRKRDDTRPPRTTRPRTGGGFERDSAAPPSYERRRADGGGFVPRDARSTRDTDARRDTRPPARNGRPPARRFTPREEATAPVDAGGGEALRDPYQRAQRPRPAGTFTVTLDPDVARVFRGDASVNKALRLVLQLMEVAAPRPPRGAAERGAPMRAAGGYRGSPQARGFVRKPRFDEDED
jgi:hypothetical protein